jgi:hypothetical protein
VWLAGGILDIIIAWSLLSDYYYYINGVLLRKSTERKDQADGTYLEHTTQFQRRKGKK